MTPDCCSCASAERLRRPAGVSEQGLLGTGGRDHTHEALRTPGPAQHLHPGVRLCGLDQEGHGDGVAAPQRRFMFNFYMLLLNTVITR